MKKLSFLHSRDFIHELDIREDTIKMAPFQGEICTVFNAQSSIHGALVIKTALREMQINKDGQDEIRQNKQGYGCIPSSFRPEILATDQEDTFLVMPNVGKPLRDLLWENRRAPNVSINIVDGFLGNLSQLFDETTTHDVEAKNVSLDRLRNMGQFFLKKDFFPNQLGDIFVQSVNNIRKNGNDVVALATLDFTQGNLLIDANRTPQSLKVIDPKSPWLVRGNPSFLGISEVDLGMFFITLSLNAPDIVQDLGIEDRLRKIGQRLRDDAQISNFSFELGKLLGCILVSSFPNTVERVETYFKSVDANCDENTRDLVIKERERYVRKAIEIADGMSLI